MKPLLDTPAALWWLAGDGRLSKDAAAVISDPENALCASVVAGYEIGLKLRRGHMTRPFARELAPYLEMAGIPALALDMSHRSLGALLDSGTTATPGTGSWRRRLV